MRRAHGARSGARTLVLRAAIVIAAALATVIFLSVSEAAFFDGEAGDAIRLAILFGVFGGALSVAMSFAGRSGGRMPEELRDDAITWIRPVVGGAAAVAVYLFLRAGVLPFVELRDEWVVAALSFLAGFGERWFLGVVQSVERRTAGEGATEDANG